jgi:hypothetical protein
MNTPFEDYLDAISSNQSLKDMIVQHFFRKTPVFFALSYFALYIDYIYPRGGVGAFIGTLEDAIRKNGGGIRYGTEIVRVEAHEKKIMDSDGGVYRYKRMIRAGDLKALYARSTVDGFGKKNRLYSHDAGKRQRRAGEPSRCSRCLRLRKCRSGRSGRLRTGTYSTLPTGKGSVRFVQQS